MEDFKILSKMELVTEDEEILFGLLQDIIDDKIHVSVASDDKNFKILRVGDPINGIVYNDTILTSFDGVISNRIPGNLPIYEISFLKNFTKVQRRKDVRVIYNTPIQYSDNKFLLKVDVDQEKTVDIISRNSRYLNNGWISDLSAGGLRFTCDKKYSLGNTLLLVFDLDDESIILKGQIVNNELKVTPDKITYIYGIKFIDISEKKKEKIIAHNFVIMRRNRSKRRG